jgi:hypothetical protein
MKWKSRLMEIVVGGSLALLLSPLLLGIWLFYSVYEFLLALAWWRKHGRHGRRFLVVYSESPKWSAFFDEEVVPMVGDQAIVVDISKAPSWKSSSSLERRAHRRWGGEVEHTPMVIHFRRPWRAEAVRFFHAFLQRQYGDSSELGAQLAKLTQLARGTGCA